MFEQEMLLVQLMYLGYPVLTFEEWVNKYWASDYETEYSDRYLGSLTFGEYDEIQREGYRSWLEEVKENPDDWEERKQIMKTIKLKDISEIREAMKFQWGPHNFNGPESIDIRNLSTTIAAEYSCQYSERDVEHMIRQCIIFLFSYSGTLPTKGEVETLFEDRFKEEN